MSRRILSGRVVKNLLIDVGLTICALLVFALFHHVMPRAQVSEGIVIENPSLTARAESVQSAEALPAVEETKTLPVDSASEAVSSATRTTTQYSGSQNASVSQKTSRKRGSKSNGDAPSSKGGSALGAGETGSDTQTETTDMSRKFSEKYTDQVVVSENSYTSPNVAIYMSEHSALNGRATYYVADIYLKDVTSFRTALAEDSYGSGFRASVSEMALLNDALLAVNGDYYGNTTEGVVIRNGVIYRANATGNDVCVLYYDGSMRVMSGSAFSVEEAIEDGAWQAWTFGPALLDGEGKAITSFTSSAFMSGANPRTAIGYYEPGHYCLVVVDGRGESQGMTLSQLSQLFESMGCRAAYNLDGGKSSVMVWQDEVYNQPAGGGRESSDALLIAEVNGNG